MPVRTEGHALDFCLMAREGLQLTPAEGLPKADGFVIACTDPMLAVCAKGYTPDDALVAGTSTQLFAAGRPNADSIVEACTGQSRAVWTESYARDRFLVASERAEFLSGGRLPDANRF